VRVAGGRSGSNNSSSASGTISSADDKKKCVTHTVCPKGKYTPTIGTAAAQPVCTACAAGKFKAAARAASIALDADACLLTSSQIVPGTTYVLIDGRKERAAFINKFRNSFAKETQCKSAQSTWLRSRKPAADACWRTPS